MTRTARAGQPRGPRRTGDDTTAPAGDQIVVDGVPVPLRPGDTVAACLLGEGRLSWRRTRQTGRPRGVFCGIGVCFDCLVTVNGTPGVRACRYTAAPGDEIRTGPAEPNEDEVGQ
ncbi:MAG: (2Fe-2S)-binding protein [Actinocatenispora sp.]